MSGGIVGLVLGVLVLCVVVRPTALRKPSSTPRALLAVALVPAALVPPTWLAIAYGEWLATRHRHCPDDLNIHLTGGVPTHVLVFVIFVAAPAVAALGITVACAIAIRYVATDDVRRAP